jgi:S1-C subfamily serine protease
MKLLRLLCLLPWLAACSADETSFDRDRGIAGWLDASVQLYSEREGGKRRFGSGVVLDLREDGRVLIATAAHVLRPESDERVYAINPGNGQSSEARILAVDEAADAALIEAGELAVKPVRLKSEARLGDDIWVVSFPWGRKGTLVTGIVSQVSRADQGAAIPYEGAVRLIDAAVSYGTSGAGVFDGRTGSLVGIVRGYRTAKLALPGPEPAALDLPIAGETTVVPTQAILCLIAQTDYAAQMRAKDAPTCDKTESARADAAS